MSDIWIEKYRPATLDEVVGNEHNIARLRKLARSGNVPNLLLAGPPGTGKTTAILALARELLGKKFSEATMELNASDDRGIDVVRDKIKTFAKERQKLAHGVHKIVILDEVDSMTEAAQQALRRLMENHSDTTRFALACNQSTKIIEPIQSRCSIVRFGRLSDQEILRRMLYVCDKEKVAYVDAGLDALIFTAGGDLRNALNNLQATVNGFSIVNKENVVKVCDMPPPDKAKSILEECKKSKWESAHFIAEDLVKEGYTPLDILQVIRSVLGRFDIKEHVKVEYLKEISRGHLVMCEGACTMLQLDKLLCKLCQMSLVLGA